MFTIGKFEKRGEKFSFDIFETVFFILSFLFSFFFSLYLCFNIFDFFFFFVNTDSTNKIWKYFSFFKNREWDKNFGENCNFFLASTKVFSCFLSCSIFTDINKTILNMLEIFIFTLYYHSYFVVFSCSYLSFILIRFEPLIFGKFDRYF